MKTSCFSKFKRGTGVCIALRHPDNFKGACYPPLFPKWSFLSKYFKDGDKEAYTREYRRQILSKLNPEKVYSDLKDSTLLCWEPAGEFCHRRLVAQWLEESLGVKVEEERVCR